MRTLLSAYDAALAIPFLRYGRASTRAGEEVGRDTYFLVELGARALRVISMLPGALTLGVSGTSTSSQSISSSSLSTALAAALALDVEAILIVAVAERNRK